MSLLLFSSFHKKKERKNHVTCETELFISLLFLFSFYVFFFNIRNSSSMTMMMFPYHDCLFFIFLKKE